jgi:hypothetical protein
MQQTYEGFAHGAHREEGSSELTVTGCTAQTLWCTRSRSLRYASGPSDARSKALLMVL